MAKFEKEVHLKCPLQPHTYYRYLDDIVWTHGEDSFMDYFNILNDHEPPSVSNMSCGKRGLISWIPHILKSSR